MNNEYVQMLSAFGGFVVDNWMLFLGLAALILIGKFIKMSIGVLKTLLIVYVLFVVYKYQDYEQIKGQLLSDVDKVNVKIEPLKNAIDTNLSNKIGEENKGVVDRFVNENKLLIKDSLLKTDEIISNEIRKAK